MISILVAMLLQAAPDGASSLPPMVANPEWVRRPSGEDFARFYPEKAERQEVTGRATIFCSVSAQGTLTDCKVIEDFPNGFGFGEAAMKMSSLFLMRPMSKDGQAVDGGTVRIPIRFLLPGNAGLDPLSVMLGCYGQAAAAAEREPSNLELTAAYTYFAAQVAFREREARAAPRAFEMNLVGAREGAATVGKAGGSGTPGLEPCLDAFRNAQKPN